MLDFAVYLKRFASAFPHSSFGRTEDRSPPRNHFCETRSSSGSYVTQRGIQYTINLEEIVTRRKIRMDRSHSFTSNERDDAMFWIIVEAAHTHKRKAFRDDICNAKAARVHSRRDSWRRISIPKGKSVGVARNCSLPEISNFVRRRDRSLLSSFAA